MSLGKEERRGVPCAPRENHRGGFHSCKSFRTPKSCRPWWLGKLLLQRDSVRSSHFGPGWSKHKQLHDLWLPSSIQARWGLERGLPGKRRQDMVGIAPCGPSRCRLSGKRCLERRRNGAERGWGGGAGTVARPRMSPTAAVRSSAQDTW